MNSFSRDTFFFLVPFLLLSCSLEKQALVEQIEIKQGWEFRQSGKDAWYPSVVPGTVHSDLFSNELIPDPFYSCNEKKLQWIGETDWVYRVAFQVDKGLLEKKNIQLVFEGLDTYAAVYLNGEIILSANNMFRKWEVDCRDNLKEGDNLLEIHFQSALQRFNEDSLALGYPLPGGQWVFARKAAYHFGWDWGPRFITCGIWKPVYLEAWEDHLPMDAYLTTGYVDKSRAGLTAILEIKSEVEESVLVKISDKNGKVYARETINLTIGESRYKVDFDIQDPKLWWTNGLGDPFLYDFIIELGTKEGLIYRKEIPYGIRTLEVIDETDEHGSPLMVMLNGHPVFMKGANYIPQHSFLPNVTAENYERTISMAKESNMNMLRVWGGGVYEKDLFYELCNRNGILVWQDFMFACAMYPGDDDFVENVKEEAVQQVKRLRKFSNLALWCGNNESDEGWHNWGWQRTHNISLEDSARIWNGYQKIFHEILPDIVNEYDPSRYYLSSSPLFGWGRSESLKHGSAHYWGVWWGRQPFEVYLEKIPRFMSEYGLQAMPSLSAIRSFTPGGEEFLFSETLQCHQKHPTGYENIEIYLKNENLNPRNLKEFIYYSQLIQAKGIGMAIEAHRRAKPYCMGTLYWQLNDCWPVVSWSGTDLYGNRKALQYMVKQLFDDILVSALIRNNNLEVYLVSDRLEDTEGKLEIQLVNFNGLWTPVIERNITIPANSSIPVYQIDIDSLFSGLDKTTNLIDLKFQTKNSRNYRNIVFPVSYGNLSLPKAEFTWNIKKKKNGYEVELTSSSFAAFVQLYLSQDHAVFHDNFFHLLPGEKRKVFCESKLDESELKNQFSVFHLGDYIHSPEPN